MQIAKPKVEEKENEDDVNEDDEIDDDENESIADDVRLAMTNYLFSKHTYIKTKTFFKIILVLQVWPVQNHQIHLKTQLQINQQSNKHQKFRNHRRKYHNRRQNLLLPLPWQPPTPPGCLATPKNQQIRAEIR